MREIKDTSCLESLKPCHEIIENLITSQDENPSGNRTYNKVINLFRTL